MSAGSPGCLLSLFLQQSSINFVELMDWLKERREKQRQPPPQEQQPAASHQQIKEIKFLLICLVGWAAAGLFPWCRPQQSTPATFISFLILKEKWKELLGCLRRLAQSPPKDKLKFIFCLLPAPITDIIFDWINSIKKFYLFLLKREEKKWNDFSSAARSIEK